jgi:hypothetical protein
MDLIANSLGLHTSGHFANVVSCRDPALDAEPPVLVADELVWVWLSPGGEAILICLPMRPRNYRWKADHTGCHPEKVDEGGFLLLDIFLARCARGGPSFVGKFVGFTVAKPMGGKTQSRCGMLCHV